MKYTHLIDVALKSCIAETDKPYGVLAQAMRYSLLNGGKRLRGNLVMMFCEAFDGNTDCAMPLACAIEMVHAHSLVHDDLPCMDDDDLRRGKPSCHKVYGEATALLVGDALLNAAYRHISASDMLTDTQKVLAVRCLSKCTGEEGMLAGQILDKLCEDEQTDIETLKLIHRKKTGALITASCFLGLIAANRVDNETMSSTKIYGDALGQAFQITDDILDVTGKTEVLGKPVGSDEGKQKNTYVSLCGIEKARQKAAENTEIAVNAVKPYGEKAEPLIEIARKMLERKS